MISRYLSSICFDLELGRQMRFISGPRQIGKTTLAREHLESRRCQDLYYNWDLRTVRDRYKKDPYFFHSDILQKHSQMKLPSVCFDEIHKYPKWKNLLKDFFDSFENKYLFVITGSARLDLFKKSGDALTGRYMPFRLHPLSLFEVSNKILLIPGGSALDFLESKLACSPDPEGLSELLRWGGFPEPFARGKAAFASHWHKEYFQSVIHEDLRDLTRIHELENIMTLIELLKDRVGAPLSLNSLREDIGVSYNAVKSYLKALLLTYSVFQLAPYSKKISRAIKKETKTYFTDWSQVSDESKRFENYVACELQHQCDLWTLSGEHRFDLCFIRTREGKETDFLVLRDSKPFFLVEAKLSAESIDSHHFSQAVALGKIPYVQVVQKDGIAKAGKNQDFVVSASRFFSGPERAGALKGKIKIKGDIQKTGIKWDAES